MNIGFIGLGIMGKPMAKNLVKAGYDVYVYNRSCAAVDELAAAGANACASIAEVCAHSEIIITMLPNGPDVKAVALNAGGIADHARPGTLLVDMSSIAPETTREIHAALKEKGVHMIDAPVSGGEPKAIDGSLAIMVGGREEDYVRARPLFEVMGSSATLVGDIGSGNTCKLANQVIVALNIAALAEGLMLARKAGADPQRVFEAIRGGLAGSTVMNAKAPMMIAGEFKPGFRIDLHIKDLHNALDTGEASGSPLPLCAQAMQIFQNLKADGCEKMDHSAMALYYEKLSGQTIG